MLVNTSVAAATAVVNYDLCTGKVWRTRNYARMLTRIGACGSAAAGDTLFDLFVNGILMGQFVNTATGWPTRDHMFPQAIPIPANALIEMIVTDAATTNPINVVVEFMP